MPEPAPKQKVYLTRPPKAVSKMTPEERRAYAAQIVDAAHARMKRP